MGYDETVQGWCRLPRSIDFAIAELPPVDGYTFDDLDRRRWDACVTGERRDHLLFATSGKGQGLRYVAMLRSVLRHAGGGYGIVVVTGEICHDGRDRVVLFRDDRLTCVPLRRLYDEPSGWAQIYACSHYMGREPDRWVAPDPVALRSLLGMHTTVNGWLHLQDFHRPDFQRTFADVVTKISTAEPALAGHIATMSQYCEPYILFGRDGLGDLTSIVQTLARVTGDQSGSYGLLYCGVDGDQGRSQRPIAFEAGRALVLPEVSIDPAGEPEDGVGLPLLLIRSPLGLDRLYVAVAEQLGAEMFRASPAFGDWTYIGGQLAYRITVGRHTLLLTASGPHFQIRLLSPSDTETAAWTSTALARLRRAGIDAEPLSS